MSHRHLMSNITPATLLVLTEQVGKLYPHEDSVDSYVNPLIDWMTQEWQSLKKRIVDILMSYARGKRINEALNEAEVWFPSGKQNQVWQDIEALLKTYGHGVDGKAKDLEQKAKIAANPLTSWSDVAPVRLALSRESVEAVIKELQWQKDFVDDLKADTKTRVSKLLDSRYGSLGEFRLGVERTLRVDRDNVINAFKGQARGFGQQVIDGKMSADEFIEAMQSSIENHYKSLYRQGKGIQTLSEWEEELILRQAQTQNQYLRNFGDYIRQKQALGKDLTPYVTARAELYGERGKSLFEAGNVAAMPDDALLDWKMQPAEHCSTCPVYQSNSPYTKQTLPGFPGEGFHLSQCGVNCKCMVVLSDLYVTQKDLGFDLGRGFMPIPETPVNVTDILTKAAGTVAQMIRESTVYILKDDQDKLIPYKLELENKSKELVEANQRFLRKKPSQRVPQDYYDYNKASKACTKARKEYENIQNDISKKSRPFLYQNDGFSINATTERKELQNQLREISKFFNKDLVEGQSIPLNIKTTKRPYFEKTIDISSGKTTLTLGVNKNESVVAHEIGHYIEESAPEIKQTCYKFWEQRTVGDGFEFRQLKKDFPGESYSSDEYYKKDNFIDPYMGKIYDKNQTEILSMGLQYLLRNPYELATKDPEYFDFIINILHGIK